jgi:glucose/arabinose dehydrogenase
MGGNRFRSALAFCLACLLTQIVTAAAPQATPPDGFDDQLVMAVANVPTSMAFTPDGRILVTDKDGKLRVISNALLSGATPTATIAIDMSLTNRVCNNSERGLLGVAVDPAFGTGDNRFIYLYYTFNKFSQTASNCSTNNSSTPVNRVGRFVLQDSNTVALASETILIDNIPSNNANHNAGDLQFGKDGYLYITVGDGGCDIRFLGDTSKCGGNNAVARDQSYLLGKILRIKPDGGLPGSNPFSATGVACALTGRNTQSKPCQETFAFGLRNPFRMAMDPSASATRFFINDVGQDKWEEIDEGAIGADYGWNICEGKHLRNQTTVCPFAANGYTDALFDYVHGAASGIFTGCNSITGGAFVPEGVWPAQYSGVYIFGDYGCGKLYSLTSAGGSYSAGEFVTGVGGVTELDFGPYNGTQALYYITFNGGGQLRRIVYTSSANRSPNAVIGADPTAGDPPLKVTFSASGSSDPDLDPLTYSWSFGDGTPDGAGASVSHTYQNTGTYTATLTVGDGRGGSGTAARRIDVGNLAPQPQITAPAPDGRFAVGQQIVLTGRASDREDGALAGDRLSWRALLHHDQHTHPYLAPTAGLSATLNFPAPENLLAAETSYLEVFLTAADSKGLTTTVTETLLPRRVAITLATEPAGLSLTANGDAVSAPRTVTSWEGYQIALSAPLLQPDQSGQLLLFTGWGDTPDAARLITTPAAPATFTANYAPARQLFLPVIGKAP